MADYRQLRLSISYPGVAQMVERVVWERIGIHPTGSNQNAETH